MSRSPLLGLLCLVSAIVSGHPVSAADAASAARAKAELVQVAAQATALSRAFTLIHEIAGPSVVSIHTSKQVRQYRMLNRFEVREETNEIEVGEGSGFVVHSDDQTSFILTNAHVVLQANERQGFVRDRSGQAMGYDKVTVVTNDTRRYEADYVGYDVLTDLALLKVKVPRLPPVDWGDSDRAKVGDFVLALGFPFRVGYSATSGIISATDRSTGVYEAVGGFESFIQTDASINPGNSGGPLFNIEGKVIGVNSNIVSRTGTSIGIGFAIPSNLARRVTEDLLGKGKVTRPMIGVYLDELAPDDAKGLGLPAVQVVRINALIPGAPAEGAGAAPGDIILAINQMPINSVQQFRARVASCRIAVPLEMRVRRADQELVLKVTPAAEDELSARLEAAARNRPKEPEAGGFGVVAAHDGKPGLVITKVVAGGLAEQAGLAVGDRILRERDFGEIRRVEDLDKLQRNREVVLQVLKDGRSLWVKLRR